MPESVAAVAIAACISIVLIGHCCAKVQDPHQFTEDAHWDGLGQCVKLAVANSGKVFCADKRGWIRVFDSVRADSNSYVELWRAERDLTATWGDHGLLGMAVAPNYPTDPYIYVLMSVNRGTSPTDPRPVLPDPSVCPAGDGLAIDGSCDSTAHLVRLKGDDTHAAVDGVLYVGWCSNGLSHHIGNLAWARDGGLFVSGGDGSSYTVDDRGRPGAPCHVESDRRPQGVWRSQWDQYPHGKLLYVPKAKLASATPLVLGIDIVVKARGLRNPFRFAIHPETNDIYVGDVGSDFYEEINVIPDPVNPGNAAIPNFGWPCFEGNVPQPSYGADPGCTQLVGPVVKPFLAYSRQKGFHIPGAQEHCMRNTVSPAAFAFHSGKGWGPSWKNRLLWADSSMQCIFAFRNAPNGKPDPGALELISYNDDDPGADRGTQAQLKWVDFLIGSDDGALYALNFDQSSTSKYTFIGNGHQSEIMGRAASGTAAAPSANQGNAMEDTTVDDASSSPALIGVLAAAFVILLGTVLVLVYRRRRRKDRRRSLDDEFVPDDRTGTLRQPVGQVRAGVRQRTAPSP